MWPPVVDQATSWTLPTSHSVVIIWGKSKSLASVPKDTPPPGHFEPGGLVSLSLGQPQGLPPKTPQPPPRLGACPGAAQGFLSSTHLTPHFSLRLRRPVWLLVTGPTPLNSSPTPPVYAWSVSQDLIFFTARPELASWTIGSEKTSSLFNSSIGVATPACQVGGQRTPPWAETEPMKAKGRRVRDMLMIKPCLTFSGFGELLRACIQGGSTRCTSVSKCSSYMCTHPVTVLSLQKSGQWPINVSFVRAFKGTQLFKL